LRVVSGKGNGSREDTPGAPEDARKKRVERVKETIEDGNFVVKPRKVADKIIDDALQKIRSRKR
jgi:anti-sigma28 factor (negative regulator of flagellin synthesis)